MVAGERMRASGFSIAVCDTVCCERSRTARSRVRLASASRSSAATWISAVWLWFTRASCERSASSRLRTRARDSRTAASSAWTTRPVSEPTARSISCSRDRAARTSGWLAPSVAESRSRSARAVSRMARCCTRLEAPSAGHVGTAAAAPRRGQPRLGHGQDVARLDQVVVDLADLLGRQRRAHAAREAGGGAQLGDARLGLAKFLPQLADPAIEPVIGATHRVELRLELVGDVELGGEVRRIHRQARILRGEAHGQYARIAHHRHLQPVAHRFGRGDLGALLRRARGRWLGRHQFGEARRDAVQPPRRARRSSDTAGPRPASPRRPTRRTRHCSSGRTAGRCAARRTGCGSPRPGWRAPHPSSSRRAGCSAARAPRSPSARTSPSCCAV